MEDIVCEVGNEDVNEQGFPPGFRFHPTDEELITFYLASKVYNGSFCTGVEIAEVDLNRCEPWELPVVAKMGAEREWYLFSLRDRKYPTGLRTNRATGAGYWKATGKDRQVYSNSNGGPLLIGMKKTLVFYKGRAPRGHKTRWVMHEYRLDGHLSYPHSHTAKDEWVICRVYHKTADKKSTSNSLHHQLAEAVADPFPTTTGNSVASSLPLLQTPFTIYQNQEGQQNQNHELFLKTLMFQPHSYQPAFSPTPGSKKSPNEKYASILSQHFKDQTAKLCKTESTFSRFQLPDTANLQQWAAGKINQNGRHLLLEMDYDGALGFSSAADTTTVADMGTGFDMMMLRPSMGALGQFWHMPP